MRHVFVDTFYWIARINPRDQWHKKAREINSTLKDAHLITSDAVLIELLNYFSNYGPEMRKRVALIARQIVEESRVKDSRIEIFGSFIAPWLPTPSAFEEGLDLFESRLDKGYSMTDCLSMSLMRRLDVTEVLTHDHHFTQEGFVTLL